MFNKDNRKISNGFEPALQWADKRVISAVITGGRDDLFDVLGGDWSTRRPGHLVA